MKKFDLSFLQHWAADQYHDRSTDEQKSIALARDALQKAEMVIIALGGKAGRLGECVVATGLLEGILQALLYCGRIGTSVRIVVDAHMQNMFEAGQYRVRYWPEIDVVAAPVQEQNLWQLALQSGERVLAVDLLGAHDGIPFIEVENDVTLLSNLFRVAVRNYAVRGPERRYADFIEDVFALPVASMKGAQVQPYLALSAEERARYPELAGELEIRTDALLIVCFFQSVVLAKCYELWDEVMQLISEHVAETTPTQQLDFLIACGPDRDLPPEIRREVMEEVFLPFTGVNANARVLVREIVPLRDLMIVIRHAKLVLSNDTGPGHIVGALQVPVVVPYLPGNLYSMRVWASTLWHRGVTLEPNPYTFSQLEAAVLWGKTEYISSIPPEALAAEALQFLP